MNYNEDIMIRVRVTTTMRDEFKKTCEANDTSMSDLIRGWITEYVATHNNVATNDVPIVSRNKTGQVVATTTIQLSKENDVVTYYKNQPIAKKYYVATKNNIELANGVTVRRLSK